jgi:hypothetical protein
MNVVCSNEVLCGPVTLHHKGPVASVCASDTLSAVCDAHLACHPVNAGGYPSW